MKPLLILIITLALSACTHAFACKGFPQFSACKSATQAYQATDKGSPSKDPAEGERAEADHLMPAMGQDLSTPSQRIVRSPPQTLKIWLAPYEDDQGDLIGSSTILTEVEPRRWRIGESQSPVPRRLIPLQTATSNPSTTKAVSEDRGGFPLFPSAQGPRRLHVEEVDYREP